ncbi:MAG: AraC family transcriptional regulator [Opitutales bacterium]|nr:AraC family transcriptional regulator [Opitutales bacterium]NRA26870.1 helix-turn-helix transcriptional regulator [Opitutales bacterium]
MESIDYVLKSAHIFYCPPDFSYAFKDQLQSWSGYILGITLDGKGVFRRPGHEKILTRGETYLIHLHEHDYSIQNLTTDTWALAWIYFQPVSPHPPLKEHQCIPDILFVEQLLYRLTQSFKEKEKSVTQSWFSALLDLLSTPSKAKISLFENDQYHARRMNQLIRKVRAKPQNRWSIKEMAHIVGMSPTHFTRVFTRQIGQSPGRFLIETRLEMARSFLEISTMPVAEIAAKLGYHDAFAFSHQFKKYQGVSPKAWRDKSSG